MIHYLEQTKLLNYNHSAIQGLIRSRQWSSLSVKNQILSVYNYVRDEIEFGYNRRDDIPASEVPQDVYGQCNTKGILFMALLRALGIPCRIHGFTIHKQQKGAMNSWYYRLSPDEIIHSWIEVMYKGDWLNMEVFVLFCFVIDLPYLNKLQQKFKPCSGSFCGYGVATDDVQNPAVFWDENDTYVQKPNKNTERFSKFSVSFRVKVRINPCLQARSLRIKMDYRLNILLCMLGHIFVHRLNWLFLLGQMLDDSNSRS